MTLFRPCIDLHLGCVKQIVGGTLDDSEKPKTNFVSERSSGFFAEMYRRDGLVGGHIIQLGSGNQSAAREALLAWPGGMQLGGGISPSNARSWLDAGAAKVVVTSWLFDGGRFSNSRLDELGRVVRPEELVVDLSCRRKGEKWFVAIHRWQTLTDVEINRATLDIFATCASEFLIHAADVEGLRAGIDEDLVRLLGATSPLPCTYAGGGKAVSDLQRVEELSGGRVDLTFGSALDIFGGNEVRYGDCVAFNRSRGQPPMS